MLESLLFWAALFFGALFLIGQFKKGLTSSKPKASTYVPSGVRRVSFDYLDQDGNLTSREVTVRRYRGGKIYAFCHLRDDDRTFFADSIIGDVVDVRTGELLDRRAWLDTL